MRRGFPPWLVPCWLLAAAAVALHAPPRARLRPDALLWQDEEPAAATVSVDTGATISQTGERFMCWNVNLSYNTRVFLTQLPDPQLVYLAAQIGPSVLRVGGTSGDKMTYSLKQPCDEAYCFNVTWWQNLYDFSQHVGADMVFGLNITPRNGTHWDPTNARELLQFIVDHDQVVWGFELGNEQNKALSGAEQAFETVQLQLLLEELYPQEDTRPYILGPDPHSFHGESGSLVFFLEEYMDTATALGLRLRAVTHHEYIETNTTESLKPERLDMTAQIASQFMNALRSHGPSWEGWGGEIGPHNNGNVTCDPTPTLWGNFADSFWYVDALGTKAAAGYATFCRQSLIGNDYSILGCKTMDPLPDYYMAVMWNRLMGRGVLAAESSVSDVRTYAHCSAENKGGIAVVVLNLSSSTTTVAIDTKSGRRNGDVTVVEYQFTTPDVAGRVVLLNGRELVLSDDGKLPDLSGSTSTQSSVQVTANPRSITFVVLPDLGVSACM